MGEPSGQANQSGSTQNDSRPVGQGDTQQRQPQQQQQHQQQPDAPQNGAVQGTKAVSWFTETFLRAAIALIGVVLLLVAVGQMAGVDTFSIIGSILASDLAQWGAVALFGLLLVVAASKSWTFVSQGQ